MFVLACLHAALLVSSSAVIKTYSHFDISDAGDSGSANAVQIVRRTATGNLELVEEGLRLLAAMEGPYRVVGVVGNFHTGKSFLMNQLMGRMGGFETGPTVKPTTEGVWFWGQTLLVPETGMKILLFDSEGLSAPENTADYDAKIFAVMALLSSHFIYNSVRIIDQAAMEYLQVLARRAQLFSLKTSLNSGGDLQVESMLQFPPLTWVVQDFFQKLIDNETPTQWLHRLMDEQAKTHGSLEGLKTIFPSAHCKTLFFPTTELEDLTYLDKQDAAVLTERYKKDKDGLVAHIIANLHMSEQQGGNEVQKLGVAPTGWWSGRSGAQISSLVSVLVDAANRGQMDSIPSMWELFIQKQITAAEQQSQRVFKITLNPFFTLEPPLLPEEFKKEIARAIERSKTVFTQAIFGLKNEAAQAANAHLDEELTSAMGKEISDHKLRMSAFVKRHVDAAVEDLKEHVQVILLPRPSKELHNELIKMRQKVSIGVHEMFKKYTDDLKTTFDLALDGITLGKEQENRDVFAKRLTDAMSETETRYTVSMQTSVGDDAQSTETLGQLHTAARTEALLVWAELVKVIKDEPQTREFVTDVRKKLEASQQHFYKANEIKVQKVCEKAVENAKRSAKQGFDNYRKGMPYDESEMNKYETEVAKAAEQSYEVEVKRFANSKSYENIKENILRVRLRELRMEFHDKNIEVLSRLVTEPLSIASRRSKDISYSCWTRVGFLRQARAIAHEELTRHSSQLQGSQKTKVVERWLEKEMVSIGPSSNQDILFMVLTALLVCSAAFMAFSRLR